MRPAIPPARMPPPNSKYTRPVIPPSVAEEQRQFAQLCGNGSYQTVVDTVVSGACTEESLTRGLCAAIQQNHLDIAKYLLEQKVSISSDVLITAGLVKSLPVFQLLLEYGWNINTIMPPGGNLTMLNNVLENEELTRWFLDHGAQPDLPQSDHDLASSYRPPSSSCLEIAAQVSSVATFDLLVQRGAKRERIIPLHLAAGSKSNEDRVSMMSHLLALGYDVDAVDDVKGNHSIGTPLHYAIMADLPTRVSLLLQLGADPHKPVGRCGSAYKMAELMGRDECVAHMKRPQEERACSSWGVKK